MLKPTPEELQRAEELNIEAEGLNGIELREAITKAERLAQFAGKSKVNSGDLNQYHALVAVARNLDIEVERGTSFIDLRRQVTYRLDGLLLEKGMEPGVKIEYGAKAPHHAGKRAQVIRTDITWTMNMPHIALLFEYLGRVYNYYAHDVVLFATVVS